MDEKQNPKKFFKITLRPIKIEKNIYITSELENISAKKFWQIGGRRIGRKNRKKLNKESSIKDWTKSAESTNVNQRTSQYIKASKINCDPSSFL